MRTFALLSVVLLASSAGAAVPATAPSPSDSPLVAAARRTHRLGKKPTLVITNETLKTMNGPARITTTDHVSAVPGNPGQPVVNEPPIGDAPAPVAVPSPAAAARNRESNRIKQISRAAAVEEGSTDYLFADAPPPVATGTIAASEAAKDSSQPRPSSNTSIPKP